MSLKIRDLSISIDNRPLLAVPELDVPASGVIGVSGPSRSGKSVLCESLLGMAGPDVRVDGSCLWGGDERVSTGRIDLRPGHEICWIGGAPRSLLDPLQRCGRQLIDSYRVGRPETTKDAATEAARGILVKLGIDDPDRRLQNYPHQISGGMAQRMVIAIALLTTAPLIVMDDALVGLDATLEMQITELLANVVREQHRSMVFVSHDPLLTRFVAEEVLFLTDGALLPVDECQQAWHAYMDLVVLSESSDGVDAL